MVPKVSVIIPAYNAMTYLPDAIESVFRQTFDDFELIIVNDGSTDGTEQYISQLADSSIRLISQENSGKSQARNKGIAEAQAEYLAFLDADDLWEPTKLDKQVSCLDRHPEVGLVYTWTAMADQEGKPTGQVVAFHAEGHVWKELIQKNIVACGSTPLVRRDCFKAIGLFSIDLPHCEDWDMWLRIATHYPIAVVKEPLVRYRQYSENSSINYQSIHKYGTLVLERAFQLATEKQLLTTEELLSLKKQVITLSIFTVAG